jgi:RNA polymerase sigma-70 factor (ECF subfamily)
METRCTRPAAGAVGTPSHVQIVDDDSASRELSPINLQFEGLVAPGATDSGRGLEHAPPRVGEGALLSLIAAGDESALGELYDRYGGVAYRLALLVVRDPGFAEDVVQDAFLSVWRSASSFDVGRGTARGWLLMLVHRRAVDLVKREQRRREQLYDLAPETVGVSAEEAAASRSDRGRVQEALRTLPEGERQALELAYYGGLSQSQIAKRLKVPLGTIKSRAFNGLRRLRAVLQDEEERLASESPARTRR